MRREPSLRRKDGRKRGLSERAATTGGRAGWRSLAIADRSGAGKGCADVDFQDRRFALRCLKKKNRRFEEGKRGGCARSRRDDDRGTARQSGNAVVFFLTHYVRYVVHQFRKLRMNQIWGIARLTRALPVARWLVARGADHTVPTRGGAVDDHRVRSQRRGRRERCPPRPHPGSAGRANARAPGRFAACPPIHAGSGLRGDHPRNCHGPGARV